MSWAGSATRFDTAEERLFCSGRSHSQLRAWASASAENRHTPLDAAMSMGLLRHPICFSAAMALRELVLEVVYQCCTIGYKRLSESATGTDEGAVDESSEFQNR